MLKHITILSLLASPALAGEPYNISVEDVYETYYDIVEDTKRVCNTVKVPVYETVNRGASGGDVLGGMLLGGILGKVVTGKDNGAAAGAVMGGVISADRNRTKQVITGYRDERQCHDEVVYRDVERKEYSFSLVVFMLDGYEYAAEFRKIRGDH
jgi:uncharacterized protein YcfJ